MMASKQNALEKLLQRKTPVHKHVAIAFTGSDKQAISRLVRLPLITRQRTSLQAA